MALVVLRTAAPHPHPQNHINNAICTTKIRNVLSIENLPLSNTEKSVHSKGLNSVPMSQKRDKFEKFLPRVQLKAFVHDKEDDSNT